MDTQNEALENVSPFEYGHFLLFLVLVSMLNFWGECMFPMFVYPVLPMILPLKI